MSSKTLSLGALALSAALNSTPILAQQSSASMTQNQIHNRIIELCKSPDSGKNIVNGTKEICDEYSTDGGKTWIKAVGGASILGLSLVALARIRKAKKEKGEEKINSTEDSDNWMSTFKGENEIDSDPDSIIPDNDESDASTQDGIDLVTEAEVYTEYGRYDQATELLQEEIAKKPKNKQAHIGLLKIYYKQKWTIDFQIKYEFVINEFKDNLTEEEITQLKTWGKEINPENPLYIESETVFEPLGDNNITDVSGNETLPDINISTDPIAEADVYMSYGRYNDAEMILKRAFQENPEKIEIHTKFLELYYKTKRPTEFQDIFMHDDMVHMRNNISGEDLVQAKAWGREIDPENPIYTELGVSTEGIVPLLETHEVGEIIDLAPVTIVPEIVEPTTEIVPPIEDIVIAHEEINPNAIIQPENIFPTPVIEPKPPVQAKFTSKNQGKLGIDKAVIARLDSLGFGIEKSEDGNSATITVLKEGVSLRYIEVGTNEPQSINQGEKYTITNATGIFYTNRSGDPTLMVRQRSGKDRYIQIIIEKK